MTHRHSLIKLPTSTHKRVNHAALALSLFAAMGTLSGCSMNSAIYEPTSAAAASTYTLSGAVQMPRGPAPAGAGLTALASPSISGATVLLYAAGTGGYGSTAQLLAMTTSSITGGGSFSFTQNAAHINLLSNITNTYSCPSYTFKSPDGTTSIVKDSLIYLVAVGGDTQDGVGVANSNPASVLMAALGDCQTLAAAPPFVNVNAVSTVASMFALAPYFNPNYAAITVNGLSTTEPGDALGVSTTYMTDYGPQVQGGYTTNGSRKSAATTPMGYTSLANAFATVPELESLASGAAIQSFMRSAAVAGGTVTVTGTPESAKINTIADILTSCVYTSATAGTPSANCQTLFAAAAPPINVYTTSLPAATVFRAATDTLQSAYSMAVNPTDNTVSGAATGGTTTNLGKLYALASAQSDFQPTLTAEPTDWTLSIVYTSASNCGTDASPGPAIGTTPQFLASDMQGNLVFVNNATAAASTSPVNTMVGIGPDGTPQFCQFGSLAPSSGPNVDLSGNIWLGDDAGVVYRSTRSGTPTAWTATVAGTPHQPFDATTDSLGNVDFLTEDDSNIYQFAGASFATTPAPAKNIYTSPSTVTYPISLTPGSTGYILTPVFDPNHTMEGILDVYLSPPGYATYAASSTTIPLVCVYCAAVDSSLRFVLANSTNSASDTLVHAVLGDNNNPTIFTKSPVQVGGMFQAGAIALDGAGNVWITSLQPNGLINGKSAFAMAEVDQNFIPISPSTGSNGSARGGYLKPSFASSTAFSIDISGNVWVAAPAGFIMGGNITEIIGAAVPVVEPLSLAARDSKIAQKP